jgi:hypothetical protein
MANKKIQKLTPEEIAEREAFMRRVRARIAERKAIDERERARKKR